MCTVRGQPANVSECLVKILEVLDSVPPKGPENNYDPNYFDTSYDYGGYGFQKQGGFGGGGRGGRGGGRGGRSGNGGGYGVSA